MINLDRAKSYHELKNQNLDENSDKDSLNA
jgi:hypothetical protein